jgi:hypothetical protein
MPSEAGIQPNCVDAGIGSNLVVHLLVLYSTGEGSFSRMEDGLIETFYLDVHRIDEHYHIVRIRHIL